MPSTILGGLIAQVESGGALPDGPWTRSNGQSYVNGMYQQFTGFVNQYGSSEAGVTNYAQQVLRANPNATLGDLYGGYFGGTGNPANASTGLFGNWGAAGAQASANWDRTLAANGYTQSTPLSTVLGGGTSSPAGVTTAAPTYSGNLGGVPNSLTVDPNSMWDASFASAANQGVGADTPNITDSTFSGLTDADIMGTSNTPGYVGSGAPSLDPSAAAGVGNDQGTPNLGGGVSSTALGAGGGVPINITDLPGLDTSITGGASTVSSGATKAGSEIQSGAQNAATGLSGTAASIFNGLQNYLTSGFVIAALVALGLIFIAFGLGMFGKRELAAVL